MNRPLSGLRRQWSWPIALAVLTVSGLLSALTGEGGIWWGVSWVALAIPLLVIIRYALCFAKSGEAGHARNRAR